MRIVSLNPKAYKINPTYEFKCKFCESVLQAKSYEFLDNMSMPGFVYCECPACHRVFSVDSKKDLKVIEDSTD